MDNQTSSKVVKRPFLEVALLALSIITIIYWGLSWFVISDVYSNKIVGAIYEILWMVMMPSLIILPVLSFMYFRKTRYRINKLPFFTFVLNIILVVMLITTIVRD